MYEFMNPAVALDAAAQAFFSRLNDSDAPATVAPLAAAN